jgi:nicotinate phosphoribosyltransferase
MIQKNTLSTDIYNQSISLLTDLYELTMAYGYWYENIHHKEAVFHLFFRRNPFKGGFTVAAGLEYVIDFIEKFQFDASDLAYLAQLKGPSQEPLFPKEFLDYLSTLRFTGQIDAIPEGSVVFPFEPLLRIQAPLIQCQLLESALLNLINFSTLIASKAARVCLAAQGDLVMEFGLRRAQGIDGALSASRAAFIGGCSSTSNLLAGKLFNIPVEGTHSHSWVMAFDEEIEAFKSYAKSHLDTSVFLVDTYDTIEGVKKAIEVGLWLKSIDKRLNGIRLDSGDLTDLSIRSRKLLDKAGLIDTAIIASNDLDETLINDLKRQGAKITIWGVGTKLVTGGNQAALDGVYKLSAIRGGVDDQWQYKIKISEQMIKISDPGILQVKRFYRHHSIIDMIYDENLKLQGPYHIVDYFDSTKEYTIDETLMSKNMLQPIFRDGKRVYDLPSLQMIKEHAQQELTGFQDGVKRFLNPHTYPVGMEKSLHDIKIKLINQLRKKVV